MTRYAIIAMLCITLLCCVNCSFARRHPAVTGAIIGVAGGTAIALATRPGTCAKFYDGKPYNGTPPCPKDTTNGK